MKTSNTLIHIVLYVLSSSSAMGTDDTLPHNACVHTQDGYITNVHHLTFIKANFSSSVLCYHSHYCRQCYILEHTMSGVVTGHECTSHKLIFSTIPGLHYTYLNDDTASVSW